MLIGGCVALVVGFSVASCQSSSSNASTVLVPREEKATKATGAVMIEGVTLSPSGNDVAVVFAGTKAGAPISSPCSQSYQLSATYTRTQLQLDLGSYKSPGHSDETCPAKGYERRVNAHLPESADGRALTDHDGHPIADVTTGSATASP